MTESKTTATTSKEGTEVKQKITRKKQLFLLFYTTGNSRGDNVMYHSAKTRRENIVKSGWYNAKIHLVFNVPIQDIAEVVTTVPSSISKRGGIGKVEVKEISIFSHSWYDGPVGSVSSSLAPIVGNQMEIKGGWDSIDYSWAPNSRFVAYGCNSGTDNEGEKVFVKELSNSPKFNFVKVWGQPSPTWPSIYRDKRETTFLRNIDTGWSVTSCYMVASVYGKGLAATRGIPLSNPEAKKAKNYLNNLLIERNYQNVFNS